MLSYPFAMAQHVPKLLCVSLNPAVDRRIRVPRMELRAVNRATDVLPTAGGKAAHVAYAAKALGAEVEWLAFAGGSEGDFCRQGVQEHGVRATPVAVSGRTRMTLEIIDESDNSVTELLEPGPSISAEECDRLIRAFERALEYKPLVALSGSLPGGVPDDLYAQLTQIAKSRERTVFLDTSGSALTRALSTEPHFIKPNRQEAEAILGTRIAGIRDALQAARTLRDRGPGTVILSLGAQGAVVWDGKNALHGSPPALKPISTVGSGDSFVAGWLCAYSSNAPIEECLRLAIACGAANCLADSPGVLSVEQVQRCAQHAVVSSL